MDCCMLFNILQQYDDMMDFNNGCTEDMLNEFENKNNIKLPQSYASLLKCFDGGEIFVPGTVIYGTGINGGTSIKDVNGREVRGCLSIPSSYLIFAKVNYGDFLCIDLNGDNRVIQWDHELNEEFCKWNCLEEWLNETIENSDK